MTLPAHLASLAIPFSSKMGVLCHWKWCIQSSKANEVIARSQCFCSTFQHSQNRLDNESHLHHQERSTRPLLIDISIKNGARWYIVIVPTPCLFPAPIFYMFSLFSSAAAALTSVGLLESSQSLLYCSLRTTVSLRFARLSVLGFGVSTIIILDTYPRYCPLPPFPSPRPHRSLMPNISSTLFLTYAYHFQSTHRPYLPFRFVFISHSV